MLTFRALQRNKTLKYGLPMLLLVVGGSFGLREFTQIRYDAQKTRKKCAPGALPGIDRVPLMRESVATQLDPTLEAKVNPQKQSVILEDEYQKMKDVNLEEWRNIRGPRPWEDSKEYQQQQRSRQGKAA
uniref:Cytochrome c oxidase assembly protein COX16 homolog, mitochondrial n=1 Tax=Hucho hucho TaxID=62062 RepID=A0A4W5K018_9TELE